MADATEDLHEIMSMTLAMYDDRAGTLRLGAILYRRIQTHRIRSRTNQPRMGPRRKLEIDTRTWKYFKQTDYFYRRR